MSTTEGVSGRVGGPISLVGGSAMGTEVKLTVYSHRGGGGCYQCLYPNINPMRVRIEFVATDKGIIINDGQVISAP